MDITKAQRNTILTKIEAIVSEKYFDPAFDNAAWNATVSRHRSTIVEAENTEAFEKAVGAMLAELSPKTLGLLSDRTPINPRNAINASFSIQTITEALRWVFQDVLPGGVAARAGVRPGDVLLAAAGKSMTPPAVSAAEPPFEMHHTIPITVARGNPVKEVSLVLNTGTPKYKDNPYSDLTALTASSQGNGISYLKVSLFPGKIGIDFANELDSIFRGRFASNDRLIIDLRGNPGGGIGGLALMSYLTPEQRPVGYKWGRKMAREHGDPSKLPVFRKIPRSRFAIPFLAIKYGRELSVYVHTEAPGRRAFR